MQIILVRQDTRTTNKQGIKYQQTPCSNMETYTNMIISTMGQNNGKKQYS